VSPLEKTDAQIPLTRGRVVPLTVTQSNQDKGQEPAPSGRNIRMDLQSVFIHNWTSSKN
jgi:hypothetical protein